MKFLLGCVLVGASLVGAPSASFASEGDCPPAKTGGRTLGWIDIGRGDVPLKAMSYQPGDTLLPPPSNANAGVSATHQPLLATQGTTVIAWHVRYGKGCLGSLNDLLDMPLGSAFEVRDRTGETLTYQITERAKVKRGKYRPEWFRTNGPAQLSLFTCADLAGGEFKNTEVLIAVPVNT